METEQTPQPQRRRTPQESALLIYGVLGESEDQRVLLDVNEVGQVEEFLPLCRLPGLKNGAWGLCLNSGSIVPVFSQATFFGRELDPSSDVKMQEIFENPSRHSYLVLMNRDRTRAVILFSRIRPLLKSESHLVKQLPRVGFAVAPASAQQEEVLRKGA